MVSSRARNRLTKVDKKISKLFFDKNDLIGATQGQNC